MQAVKNFRLAFALYEHNINNPVEHHARVVDIYTQSCLLERKTLFKAYHP